MVRSVRPPRTVHVVGRRSSVVVASAKSSKSSKLGVRWSSLSGCRCRDVVVVAVVVKVIAVVLVVVVRARTHVVVVGTSLLSGRCCCCEVIDAVAMPQCYQNDAVGAMLIERCCRRCCFVVGTRRCSNATQHRPGNTVHVVTAIVCVVAAI